MGIFSALVNRDVYFSVTRQGKQTLFLRHPYLLVLV